MALGKQAKALSRAQVEGACCYVARTRYPLRNRVILLLSVKAGLRAKEIALLTWDMVTNADGEVGDSIHLRDIASKGRSGRVIPLNRELRAALVELRVARGRGPRPTPFDAHQFEGRPPGRKVQPRASAPPIALKRASGLLNAGPLRHLGHFEGRGWRGFHHHATLCIAAYGFLICERRFPPQELVAPRCSRKLPHAKVASAEEPPLRPERHVPNSIATMRRRLVVALVTTLSRCPCCAAPIATRNRYRDL